MNIFNTNVNFPSFQAEKPQWKLEHNYSGKMTLKKIHSRVTWKENKFLRSLFEFIMLPSITNLNTATLLKTDTTEAKAGVEAIKENWT